MGEEEIGIEFLGNPLMVSELLTVVGRERMNAGGKGRQQRDHCLGDRLCHLDRHLGDQRIAGRTFIECDERLFLSRTDDQIALPVPEACPLSDHGRAQIDGYLIGNRAESLTSSVALPAGLLAAQGAMQGTARPLVGIDALIDGLVADGGLAVRLEVSGDLFRTPRFGQFDQVSAAIRGPFSQARMRACENACTCLGR